MDLVLASRCVWDILSFSHVLVWVEVVDRGLQWWDYGRDGVVTGPVWGQDLSLPLLFLVTLHCQAGSCSHLASLT